MQYINFVQLLFLFIFGLYLRPE